MTTPVFHTLDEAFRYCRDMDASLRERLDTFSAAARALGPAMQEAVDRLVVRLMAIDVGAGAPQIGDAMPNFILPDEAGELVSLESLLRVGPVAVTFHRGHWCPYCRINTRSFAEAQTKIAAAGAQIVAIMPDRQQFAVSLKHDSKMHYPVLTDMDNGYALSLNLAIWVGAEVQELMAASGRDLPRYQGNDFLDAAAAGELRRGCGGHRASALHRSGLPQANGDRGSASGSAGRANFTAPSTLVVLLLAPDRAYPFPSSSAIENPGAKRNNSASLRIGGRYVAARTRGACR